MGRKGREERVVRRGGGGRNGGEGGSGGFIPMWLYVRTIGTTGVSSIVNMREALVDHHAENE